MSTTNLESYLKLDLNGRKELFTQFLMNESNLCESTSLNYLNSLSSETLHELLFKSGINNFYSLTDVEFVSALYEDMKTEQKNIDSHNLYSSAIKKYGEFLDLLQSRTPFK